MPLEQNKNAHELRTWPLRVAGIVFWGLVVLGFVFAPFALDGRESQIRDQQQSAVERCTAQLYEGFAARPSLSVRDMGEAVRSLVHGSARIDGALVEVDGERVAIGQAGTAHIAYQRSIHVDAGQLGEARLSPYRPSGRDQLGSERRELLLAMGAVFLLFGFILQRILDQMLSRPFRQMVTAGQAFSAGDEKVRFDEWRSDEFGYLGRSINQALDYSMQQNHVLHRALTRICRRRREKPWLRCTPSATQ
jgi:methyl-accepting chemotaxis protein